MDRTIRKAPIEVTGPSVKPPQWAIDRALSHADSVVEAMAPGLDTILGLIALQAVEEKRPIYSFAARRPRRGIEA